MGDERDTAATKCGPPVRNGDGSRSFRADRAAVVFVSRRDSGLSCPTAAGNALQGLPRGLGGGRGTRSPCRRHGPAQAVADGYPPQLAFVVPRQRRKSLHGYCEPYAKCHSRPQQCTKSQKKGPRKPAAPSCARWRNYSPLIAPVGHAPSQAPQSTQRFASTTYLASPSEIASTGQVSLHAPHLTHSSLMTCAIFLNPFVNVNSPGAAVDAEALSLYPRRAKFASRIFQGRN